MDAKTDVLVMLILMFGVNAYVITAKIEALLKRIEKLEQEQTRGGG